MGSQVLLDCNLASFPQLALCSRVEGSCSLMISGAASCVSKVEHSLQDRTYVYLIPSAPLIRKRKERKKTQTHIYGSVYIAATCCLSMT